MRPLHLIFERTQVGVNRRGFTLIEILITMALMVIIGTIGVTSAVKILPRMRVDRASSRLAFQLQQARSEAMAINQNVFVELDSVQNSLTFWVDRNRDGERDSDEVTTVVLEEPHLINLDTELTQGLFNAYGQFITTPGQRRMETQTIRVSSTGSHHSVELTLRGSGAITKR